VSISAGSAQDQWLVADLAASTKQCVIAIWHTPLFLSSDEAGYIDNPSRKILWDRLYAAGADVVVNAQQHHYERFARCAPMRAPDAQFGLREFNVGTGGESIAVPTRSIHPSSLVRGGDFGVLKLTLSAGGYSWGVRPDRGGDIYRRRIRQLPREAGRRTATQPGADRVIPAGPTPPTPT